MNQFFFLLFVYCLFLQRISILVIQSAVVIVIPSVRLTVYLLHADIVSIQLKLRSCGLHWRIVP